MTNTMYADALAIVKITEMNIQNFAVLCQNYINTFDAYERNYIQDVRYLKDELIRNVEKVFNDEL